MVLFRPARKRSNGVTQVCLRATCSRPAGTGAGGTHSKPDGPLRGAGTVEFCSIFFFFPIACAGLICAALSLIHRPLGNVILRYRQRFILEKILFERQGFLCSLLREAGGITLPLIRSVATLRSWNLDKQMSIRLFKSLPLFEKKEQEKNLLWLEVSTFTPLFSLVKNRCRHPWHFSFPRSQQSTWVMRR